MGIIAWELLESDSIARWRYINMRTKNLPQYSITHKTGAVAPTKFNESIHPILLSWTTPHKLPRIVTRRATHHWIDSPWFNPSNLDAMRTAHRIPGKARRTVRRRRHPMRRPDPLAIAPEGGGETAPGACVKVGGGWSRFTQLELSCFDAGSRGHAPRCLAENSSAKQPLNHLTLGAAGRSGHNRPVASGPTIRRASCKGDPHHADQPRTRRRTAWCGPPAPFAKRDLPDRSR